MMDRTEYKARRNNILHHINLLKTRYPEEVYREIVTVLESNLASLEELINTQREESILDEEQYRLLPAFH